MNLAFKIFFAMLSLLFLFYPASALAGQGDTLESGVVKITVKTFEGKNKVGTGFIVQMEKDAVYIVTASHVVEGARDAKVEFFTRKNRPVSAKVIEMEGGDPKGLALLLVEEKIPSGLSVLHLNSVIAAGKRDPVSTIGFPRIAGISWAPVDGKIVGRSGKVIVFTGALDEGNSGGPLIKTGQVIGVVTEVTDKFAYAVRALIARDTLEGWDITPGKMSAQAEVVQPRPKKKPPKIVQAAPKKTTALKGMVFVKGGCFQMGDTFGGGGPDEKPVHEVCVDDFYMGKYEVTQKQWQMIMGENPSSFKDCDNCPVESVSWIEVQAFIKKLNRKSGENYRLPTEAEWEYAARSGGKKEKFAGFSRERALYRYGNFCDVNCEVSWKTSAQDDGFKNTAPVGSYKLNGLGLYDMSGNVWEWTEDCWHKNYKNAPKDGRAWRKENDGDCGLRVLRGGSWYSLPFNLRSAFRNWYSPDVRFDNSGFRLARTFK